MFHAVFLITIGSLLLANNFGVLPWTIWESILNYWPILIVFAGIEVVFGKSFAGRLTAGIINSAIFLLIIAKIIGFNLPFVNPVPMPKKNLEMPKYFFTQQYKRIYIN